MDKHETNEFGFTLIELLVVILIIGILAAIAIPLFLNQRKAAIEASVTSDLKNGVTAMEQTPIKNGAKYAKTLPATVLTSKGNILTLAGIQGAPNLTSLLGAIPTAQIPMSKPPNAQVDIVDGTTGVKQETVNVFMSDMTDTKPDGSYAFIITKTTSSNGFWDKYTGSTLIYVNATLARLDNSSTVKFSSLMVQTGFTSTNSFVNTFKKISLVPMPNDKLTISQAIVIYDSVPAINTDTSPSDYAYCLNATNTGSNIQKNYDSNTGKITDGPCP